MRNIATPLRRLLGYFGGGHDAHPPDCSDEQVRILEAVRPFTMTNDDRLLAVIGAVEYVVKHDIPGDIVECGVWRGGSMMAAAKTLLQRGSRERTLHLFDTFEGMPPAQDIDKTYRGESAAALLAQADREDFIWAVAGIEDVRRNVDSTGYPKERIVYVKGNVEDTIPGSAPDTIAILRLDTDWYESTRHELTHLYPRLSRGGVLIIDDYGHWQGARRAVDEYLAGVGEPLLLNRIDYTGRIAVKPL